MLQALLEAASTAVTTRAPTAANRMHLAAGFIEAVTARYGGSRLGRQELDGELILDLEGALWTWEMLEAARAPRSREPDRIVVAVDPPVSTGDEGRRVRHRGRGRRRRPARRTTGRAEVIADASVRRAVAAGLGGAGGGRVPPLRRRPASWPR